MRGNRLAPEGWGGYPSQGLLEGPPTGLGIMSEKERRQLAAIMFADMVGYTALMQEDEGKARSHMEIHRGLVASAVQGHGGEILQYYGDGTLSISGSAVEAVQAAIELQHAVAQEPILPLRIGVHTGDVVHGEDGIYGDGVNLASRIQNTSAPGGVAVSGKVFDEIKNHSSIAAIPLGPKSLKNVSHPVNVYAISNPGLKVPEGSDMPGLADPATSDERRYSDEEVRNLLAQASDLEKDGSVFLARTDGPTLLELEAIAEEAGINPLAVREAARGMEIEAPGRPFSSVKPKGFLGAPVTIRIKRVVPGEAGKEALQALTPILERASEGLGEPLIQGRTLTCHSTNKDSLRSLTVTVGPSGGDTHLVMEERYPNLAWAIHGGFVGGIGLGVGIPVGFGVGFGVGMGGLLLASFLTAVPAVCIGGSYLLSRKIYATVVNRRSAALNEVLDEMVGVLSPGTRSLPPG